MVDYRFLICSVKFTEISVPKTFPWEDKHEWTRVKQVLQEPPASGLTIQNLSPCLCTEELREPWLCLLSQEHSRRHRPIACSRMQPSSVAHAYPKCPKHTATAAELVEATAHSTVGNDIYSQTVHSVWSLTSESVQHFSTSRTASYEILQHFPPNLHLKHCNVLNPAMLLPPPEEGEPHDCEVIMPYFMTPGPDLQDAPLTSPYQILSVVGSYCKNAKGSFQAGNAVIISNMNYLRMEISHKLNQPNKRNFRPFQDMPVIRTYY